MSFQSCLELYYFTIQLPSMCEAQCEVRQDGEGGLNLKDLTVWSGGNDRVHM